MRGGPPPQTDDEDEGSPQPVTKGELTTLTATAAAVTSAGEEEDAFDQHSHYSSTSNHTKSVTSLLAMKRDRIDKERRMSVMAAVQFAEDSKRDSMVNSDRTLHMVTGKLRSSVVEIGPIVE